MKNRKNRSTGSHGITSADSPQGSFPTHRFGQAQRHNSGRLSAKTISRNSSTGQAIFPLVLILTAVFGLIGVTFAGVAYLQTLLSSQRAFAEQALQASASGIDDALLRLARNSAFYEPAIDYDLDVANSSTTVTANITVDDATGMCGTSSMLRCVEIYSTATRRNVTRSLEVIVEISLSGATRVLSRQEVVN